MIRLLAICFLSSVVMSGCSKKSSSSPPPPPPPPPALNSVSIKINNQPVGLTNNNINTTPVIKFAFSAPVNHSTVSNAFSFNDNSGGAISFNSSFENNDSTVVIQPASALSYISKYSISVSTGLKSQANGSLQSAISLSFLTAIDSSDKFPVISDDALLTLVQQQTFQILLGFWSSSKWFSKRKKFFRGCCDFGRFWFWDHGHSCCH